MRSEGYSSRSVYLSVCLIVCLFVSDYSRTTCYEAAYERYQQLQCYKGKKWRLHPATQRTVGYRSSRFSRNSAHSRPRPFLTTLIRPRCLNLVEVSHHYAYWLAICFAAMAQLYTFEFPAQTHPF